MNLLRPLLLITILANTVGCQYGVISKRHSELNCPTDIRQTHVWMFGEDAIMWGPCGLSEGSYGHKATSWRDFPMSVDEWRSLSTGCGPTAAVMPMPATAGTETFVEPEQEYQELLPPREEQLLH